LAQLAFAPQLTPWQWSMPMHVAGPPFTGVPMKPLSQLHCHEPGVLVQCAFEPQLAPAAHSSMSTQVAGAPTEGAPLKPVWQAHEYEPTVLVQSALTPQIPVVVHSFASVHEVGPPVVVVPV
jgi:hypothetical protein